MDKGVIQMVKASTVRLAAYLAIPDKVEAFLKKQNPLKGYGLRYVRLRHQYDGLKSPKRSFIVECPQFEKETAKKIEALVSFLFGLGYTLGHDVYYGMSKSFSRIYAPMAVFEKGYLSWSSGLEDKRPRMQVVLVEDDRSRALEAISHNNVLHATQNQDFINS